jgi:DNA modification methylase
MDDSAWKPIDGRSMMAGIRGTAGRVATWLAKRTRRGESPFLSPFETRAGPGPPMREQRKPAMGKRRSALVDTRVIYCGDNLDQLPKLPAACIDLIYIDPPFNSNQDYEVFWGETKEKRAFEDRHASTQAYIDFMRPRCVELARILKKTGSFYYHCDWHASHYVKVMLDQILGENQFQAEIVWKRTSAHANVIQNYARVHDAIFYYIGSRDCFTWQQQFVPYDDEYINTFFDQKDAAGRRYARRDLTASMQRASSGQLYEWKGIRPPPSRCWAMTKDRMDDLDSQGRIHWPKKKGGMPRLKLYPEDLPGVPLSDVWTDISPLHNLSQERLGYPTQKPLALFDRIIKASSNPNDIVLDAFCGCGTALESAEHLGRQWIGIDMSPTACRVMAKRLRDRCGLPEDQTLWKSGRGFVVRDLPWTEAKLRRLPPFEFENWAVIAIGGIPNKVQVGDMGIDGRIFPVHTLPVESEKKGETQQFAYMDDWYPIQVKQRDKAGRPDIDAFEAMMMRADRPKGFFVSFDYSEDAKREVQRFFKQSGKVIVLLTVQEILEEQIAMKLA